MLIKYIYKKISAQLKILDKFNIQSAYFYENTCLCIQRNLLLTLQIKPQGLRTYFHSKSQYFIVMFADSVPRKYTSDLVYSYLFIEIDS